MSMLRQHPNVVNIKGYYQDNDYYYVVQELCSGGELFDAIVSKASYSEREAQTVVRTLLYTIAYCHDRGIVHRRISRIIPILRWLTLDLLERLGSND